MMRIPLSNIPNQRFSVVLDGQNCTISLKQNGGALYLSLAVDQVGAYLQQRKPCTDLQDNRLFGASGFS